MLHFPLESVVTCVQQGDPDGDDDEDDDEDDYVFDDDNIK